MRSSLRVSSRTTVGRQEQAKLFTLWQSLQDHNDSLFFRVPVDLKAFADYGQYVEHPMDLSTVQRGLRELRYRWVEEVLDDIQLIWDNCRLYNPPETWIYGISFSMERAFHRMLRSYFPQIHLDTTTTPQKAEPVQDEEDFFPKEEVPHAQKYELIERMQLLNPPALKILVECISEVCAKAFVSEGGQAKIVVDYIDAHSFPLIREKLEELLVTTRGSTKRLKLR